ncbi:hypothetical protein EDB85DRAFT_1893107 [Lactarius pseudohatsudake]|nr:hypothetical protein EDB85DRAFT_1893107 [Lactarius pseudohatsudake]
MSVLPCGDCKGYYKPVWVTGRVVTGTGPGNDFLPLENPYPSTRVVAGFSHNKAYFSFCDRTRDYIIITIKYILKSECVVVIIVMPVLVVVAAAALPLPSPPYLAILALPSPLQWLQPSL